MKLVDNLMMTTNHPCNDTSASTVLSNISTSNSSSILGHDGDAATSSDSSDGISPYADDHLVNGFYLALMFLMASSGVIGNTLVIGSVFVHKKLMVLSNVFIVNLAVTDFFVCAFVDVFTIVGVLTKGKFFDNKHVFCEFLGVVCITTCCCSIWTMAGIALNRYVLICHRALYPTIFNKRTIPVMIAALWLLCFLVDMPNLLGWGGHTFDEKALFCTYDFMADYTYSVFFATWLFVIPFAVLFYAYISILLYSRATKKALRKAQKDSRVLQVSYIRTTDLRLLRSVLVIWIVFSALWTPYVCVLLFDYDFSWPREFYIFAVALAHLSSSTNSVIYAATNKHFRDGYRMLLKKVQCWKLCHDGHDMDLNAAYPNSISLQLTHKTCKITSNEHDGRRYSCNNAL